MHGYKQRQVGVSRYLKLGSRQQSCKFFHLRHQCKQIKWKRLVQSLQYQLYSWFDSNYVYSYKTIRLNSLLCKVLACSCWETCSFVPFLPNDRSHCGVYNYCNKPSVLPRIHQRWGGIEKNKQWHWWLMPILGCSHLNLPNHETPLSARTVFFFPCALSFQCHWLLYARYKKWCMSNQAHNGQIWLTC